MHVPSSHSRHLSTIPLDGKWIALTDNQEGADGIAESDSSCLVSAARCCAGPAALIRSHLGRGPAMQTFFVEIKCKLGKTYQVASALADREIASEIYSTAGNYDILAKFHVDDAVDIGHFVAENVQTIPEIQDTRTIITFKAF
jgi:DNA-binding Lrp family transcriptional regulator